MQLYIKQIPIKENKLTRTEFLKFYFENNQPATFDVDTDVLQCEEGKKRSFSDLLLLIKTYYPLTSKKGLIRILNKIANDTKVRGFFCDSTNNVVFFQDLHKESSNKLFSSITYNSDVHHRRKQGNDGISMNILEDWMNG